MKKKAYILTSQMAKHLVDLDEEALDAARAELGTSTLRDTVNVALRRAAASHDARVAEALDVLSSVHLAPREDAWR